MQDNQPLFSIIVASYNNGRYLPECLDSLIHQTYTNMEIVVVDDASTDESKVVINEYQKIDKRVVPCFKKKNKGVGDTKREGANICKGELIGTIGADDKLALNAIELMVQAHANHPDVGLIYSSLYFCNSKLEVKGINEAIKAIPAGETYLTWIHSTSSTISGFRTMKREMYAKTEGFSPYFKKAVDRDIILKMEEVAKTYFLNIPLYYYRLHENNISRNKNAWKAYLWEVRAKEAAYKRRLHTSIPNITKKQLIREYYFVLKALAFEALQNKKWSSYFYYIFLYLQKSGRVKQTFYLAYYTFKKTYYPKAFQHD